MAEATDAARPAEQWRGGGGCRWRVGPRAGTEKSGEHRKGSARRSARNEVRMEVCLMDSKV